MDINVNPMTIFSYKHTNVRIHAPTEINHNNLIFPMNNQEKFESRRMNERGKTMSNKQKHTQLRKINKRNLLSSYSFAFPYIYFNE